MARKRPSRRAKRSVKPKMNVCLCKAVALLGFALIVAKATDYFTGCGRVGIEVLILGLLILVAGKVMMKKCCC